MASRRDPRREQLWRQHIAAWSRSGQSIRAFCSAHHLSEASFHSWRRELAKRDRAPAPPVQFLPVHVRGEALIEVVLPDGLVVRAPAATDAIAIAALVAALRAMPC